MKNTLFSRFRGPFLLSLYSLFAVPLWSAPVLHSAYIENVQVNTADVYVSASEDAVRYKCRMNRTGLVNHDFFVTATDGKFTLTDMNQCTAHTLQIWAVDADSIVSDNSITLTYSTLGDATDLYLRGTMNGWGTDLPFRYTTTSGVYAVTTKIVAGTYEYKVANSDWSSESEHRYITLAEEKYVTFYAKGVNCFASSADSMYVVGSAVSVSSMPWANTNAVSCSWVGTQAFWKGAVYQTGAYKIIKQSNGMKYTYWNDLWNDNQSISGISSDAAFAKFTFDLPTLSWTWSELDDLCTTTGDGYSLSLYLNETGDALRVSATNQQTATPVSATFFCYDYTSSASDYSTTLEAQADSSNTFVGSIPFSNLRKSDNDKICYSVQFAYSDGTTLHTDTLFYLLEGKCSTTDTLYIYHHDQGETGDVESFNGTRIIQPIVYKRKFAPGYWETLCLPFEVTKVWVYDTEEEQDYDLYPQYLQDNNLMSGDYWLRTFTGENVSAAKVENSWTTAATGQNYLPEKNTPYLIMFPADGDYYNNKYVCFSAEGFQTIESTFSPSRPTTDDVYTYAGNTTLQPQTITNAYLLASGSEYFDGTTDGTETLYPFEAALFATQPTVAKMPRMHIPRHQDTPTRLLPMTTVAGGEVYTLWGNRVGVFASESDYATLTRSLPAGFYLVRTGNTTSKICLLK